MGRKALKEMQLELCQTSKIFEKYFREKHCTKMKFSIKDFFSRCDQIRRNLRIWSHLLKKCLMENFIFCAVKLHLRYLTGVNYEYKHTKVVDTQTRCFAN